MAVASLFSCLRIFTALVLLAGWAGRVLAYTPAQGTNDTAVMNEIQRGENASSTLFMQWYQGGQNSEVVSYQLVGTRSAGVTKGALVHFNEEMVITNLTTVTPWIALVSCDSNDTSTSTETDIFTMAHQLGAVSAVLYSLRSQGCIIDPEYAANFHQLMDIFSTESLTTSQTIEDQFVAINATVYGNYNEALLNGSSTEVKYAVDHAEVQTPGFMFATLIAYNATNGTDGNSSDAQASSNGSSSDTGPNTSLAMIILYAITGCVSALFCVVIASGAIRAIRHPERYGPRAGDPSFPSGTFGAAQSRARGLTRAILDTFPVVKFGGISQPAAPRKDVESSPGHGEGSAEDDAGASKMSVEMDPVELREWQAANEHLQLEEEDEEPHDSPVPVEDDHTPVPGPSSELPARPRPRTRSEPTGPPERDIVPGAIGTETCPICIVDFEEGDDLRVLPCEGHHRFHRECVDQWLLELSSSCPICRQDFHALEAMMAGNDDGPLEPPHMPGASQRPWSSASARFSRYLRIARRRRQREDGHGYDTTDPSISPAQESRL